MTRDAGTRWFGVGAKPADKAAFDNQCCDAATEALESLSPSKLKLPDFISVEKDQSNYPDMARPFTGEYWQQGGHAHSAGQDNTGVALAIVLLLDQLARNVYRKDQDLIYGHFDRLARAVSHDVRFRGISQDLAIGELHHYWFYMPLMHSEWIADHSELEGIIQENIRKAMEADRQDEVDSYRLQLKAAKDHSDIIRRFGRYPHRNQWLGRKATKEEQDYLNTGGATFSSG
jgi:uncharacterized protein (DUF924 family)